MPSIKDGLIFFCQLAFDDLDVHETPTCPKPTGFNVLSTNSGSVNVSWTGGASPWVVKYGPSGFNPSSAGTRVVASSNPFVLSGLAPNTAYDIYVKDSCGPACALIYEPDPLHYVVYDLRDSVEVKINEREFVTCIETASGRVESSLWGAMTAQNLDFGLVDLMEDALAYSVDFYRTQYGDEFKLMPSPDNIKLLKGLFGDGAIKLNQINEY